MGLLRLNVHQTSNLNHVHQGCCHAQRDHHDHGLWPCPGHEHVESQSRERAQVIEGVVDGRMSWLMTSAWEYSLMMPVFWLKDLSSY